MAAPNLASALAVALVVSACTTTEPAGRVLRFATFNVAMNRTAAGALATELESNASDAARACAAILQQLKPDVLLLNEVDRDAEGRTLRALETLYLAQPQEPGAAPLRYLDRFCGPVNTGHPSGFDLDHDGQSDGPGDALGFGRFPGQYGMAVLSTLPIRHEDIRTFRNLKWQEMPNAQIPPGWYSKAQRAVLPLSSKSHQDIPIVVGDRVIHFLVSHPTPPVFDGPENRNGRRNHDEIRFWADYVRDADAPWIRDDEGKAGGLQPGASFVIAGDLNADPADGDASQAIAQLLNHPRIQSQPTPSSRGAVDAAGTQAGANATHRGNPAHDTADFNDTHTGNLRADYVLPSRDLEIVDCGVFWPTTNAPGHSLSSISDHRLVWIDVRIP